MDYAGRRGGTASESGEAVRRLVYGGGTGAALTADMTLTFLAKGGYSTFYRKGRETKTGYIMYKTSLYTGFHRN